mgnify:CR=1 FL=1
MSLYTLVGYEHSKGDSTDKATGRAFSWDNWKFYLLEHENEEYDPERVGQRCETVSAPYDRFNKSTLPAVGLVCEVYYDKYGKAAMFNPVK